MKKRALLALALVAIAALAFSLKGPETRHTEAAPEPIKKDEIVKTSSTAIRSAAKIKTTALTAKSEEIFPVQVIIPSIDLNSPIVKVGLTSEGAMEVPEAPSEVGWYEYGTIPGQIGSAVLDAHVFEAFKNLKSLKIGEKIYLMMSDGSKKAFTVRTAEVFPLKSVSADRLFNRSDSRWLNLITCSGTWTEDKTTYTHRLIVSAELDPATR